MSDFAEFTEEQVKEIASIDPRIFCSDNNNSHPCCAPKPTIAEKPQVKAKRDIFRFNGDKTTAINLDHVTQILIEGNRLTFNFSSTSVYVDLEDEESAKKSFEQILGIWAGESV
jgi:hypothetical protein